MGASLCSSKICVVSAGFEIVVDAITDCAKKSLMNKTVYSDGLVLINKSMDNLREKAFEMEKGISNQEDER